MADPEVQHLKCHSAVLRLYNTRVPLTRQGKDHFGKCPFHAEKTESFSVSKAQNGEWLYHCFGCGRGGDILDFVQKLDNCPFPAALKTVQDFVGDNGALVEKVFHPVQPDPKTYATFTLERYGKLEAALAESEAGRAWLRELRGIEYETAKRLHLGFRQDLGKSAGPKNADIAGKGWISFPCIENGVVTSIKYRSIVRKVFARQQGMATGLFNLETVDVFEPVWLCEGEMDCLTLEQAGFRAVSLPNATFVLTPEMRDRLLEAEIVILAGDNDGAAGVEAMARLKADFGDRALQIDWPSPHKDANEVFLKQCKGDVAAFRALCDDLLAAARAQPMPTVYSLVDIMRRGERSNLADDPHRFRFCWPSVDKMANFLPGDIALVTATDTGMGKSQWVIQSTLEAARRHDEIVLSYQVELSAEEVANIATAQVLRKDRNTLTGEDLQQAAKILGSLRYYIGADPSLTTAGPVLNLIEKAIKRFGATVCVIDHIHFICRNSANEVQEQANAMQRIKNMARTYGVKFIVVGQPRKADQKNEGKERQLNAVKGSEALVSDASIVYFLHREVVKNIDPANPPFDDRVPETTVRNKKARSKSTGAAFTTLHFHGKIATFSEISHTAASPPETIDNFDLV